MRVFGRILATIAGALVLLIIGTVAWVKLIAYPDYSYRYRLTVSVEVDGKVHTGSSVIEVIWHGGIPFADVGPYYPSLRGQAALIDLGAHGAIVASLTNGTYGRAADGTYGAIWIAARAFGNSSTNDELPQLLKLAGRRQLSADNMPLLILFSDISNPETARKLAPGDIPKALGPNARLVEATVEITRDAIVIDLDKKLSWYARLRQPQNHGVLYLPNGLALADTMIIGEPS